MKLIMETNRLLLAIALASSLVLSRVSLANEDDFDKHQQVQPAETNVDDDGDDSRETNVDRDSDDSRETNVDDDSDQDRENDVDESPADD